MPMAGRVFSTGTTMIVRNSTMLKANILNSEPGSLAHWNQGFKVYGFGLWNHWLPTIAYSGLPGSWVYSTHPQTGRDG